MERFFKKYKWQIIFIAVFATAEILIFFLLPAVSIRWWLTYDEGAQKDAVYCSIFYLLTTSATWLNKFAFITSTVKWYDIIPYLIFIIGAILGLIKKRSIAFVILSLICIIVSWAMIFFDGSHINFSDIGINFPDFPGGQYDVSCDIREIVYSVFCSLAILVILLFNYIDKIIKWIKEHL